ncbi:hypothetical protein [Antrihabitans sp. YC2-6]|uniref:hypothetical protein n=1 Tax=Antrihabitans sp. YC2-6 TaxID=2799498 RepID=UPI0018F645D0|nr:hypothetical protein [Antrihabitans sp. YC2-6]MBJ8348580.1 hypothetical protein [Antrihabitans sp. YC2-6]
MENLEAINAFVAERDLTKTEIIELNRQLQQKYNVDAKVEAAKQHAREVIRRRGQVPRSESEATK